MEEFEKYIGTNETFEFELNGFTYSCEELSLGEEVDLFNYYIETNGLHNISRYRMVQTSKLVKVPFTSDNIKSVFDKFYPDLKIESDITWEKLNLRYRILFFEKLTKQLMNPILFAVADYYTKKESTAKK